MADYVEAEQLDPPKHKRPSGKTHRYVRMETSIYKLKMDLNAKPKELKKLVDLRSFTTQSTLIILQELSEPPRKLSP